MPLPTGAVRQARDPEEAQRESLIASIDAAALVATAQKLDAGELADRARSLVDGL